MLSLECISFPSSVPLLPHRLPLQPRSKGREPLLSRGVCSHMHLGNQKGSRLGGVVVLSCHPSSPQVGGSAVRAHPGHFMWHCLKIKHTFKRAEDVMEKEKFPLFIFYEMSFSLIYLFTPFRKVLCKNSAEKAYLWEIWMQKLETTRSTRSCSS